MSEPKTYALDETRIAVGGVLRCCALTVAHEYEGEGDSSTDQRVSLGMKSQCKHCQQSFTLVDRPFHPHWVPDWQIVAEKPSTPEMAVKSI